MLATKGEDGYGARVRIESENVEGGVAAGRWLTILTDYDQREG